MKLTDKIKENYSSEVMLLSVVCFLAGVVTGILIAPVKNGIAIGAYNGCHNDVSNYKNCNINSTDEDNDINQKE
ncbi:MAG: hypothetical protein K2G36_10680 [Ruminococcus sp.]|nr:hypothetical protein [Ruminococcus sp.]